MANSQTINNTETADHELVATSAGAYEALKSAGRADDVLIVSVDGGCPGVQNVQAGIIGATSMQFPLRMASMGVDAVLEYATNGTKPSATKGLDFVNTGG